MTTTIPVLQIDPASVLTTEEISAIKHECQHYPQPQAAAIDALMLVQRNRKWIDDDVLYAIAAQLGMTAAELEGVATFYNHIYRHPVGEHVIHLCNSISCWLLDYQDIADALTGELKIDFGETTADGKFTLLTNACLGCCGTAPALMMDGKLYEDLTPDKVIDLVRTIKDAPQHSEAEDG